MTPDELQRRTKRFAVEVIKFCDSLPRTTAGKVIGNQLVRSGTSVAANYRAACRARSKPEFAAKIGIVEEEADESAFWTELCVEAELVGSAETQKIISEAIELRRIMAASRKTSRM